MSKPNNMNCPYCGSNKIAEIQHGDGISYVITEVNINSNPPEFLPSNGIPVKIYGCLECGGLTMFNDNLKNGIS